MRRRRVLGNGALPGAVAGVIGTSVCSAVMAWLGMPAIMFPLEHGRVALAAGLIQGLLAIVGGASFGVIVWQQRFGAGEMLFWGMAYGVLGWFVLNLTVTPLLMHGTFTWSVEAAQAALSGFFASVLSGIITGLILGAFRPETRVAGTKIPGIVTRGALAGLGAVWALGWILRAQGRSLAFMATGDPAPHSAIWLSVVLVGALAGIGFALLYPLPSGSGPDLVRGTMYGFFLWVCGGLTALRLIAGSDPAWSLTAARAHFVTLPGYVLTGAGIAVVYQVGAQRSAACCCLGRGPRPGERGSGRAWIAPDRSWGARRFSGRAIVHDYHGPHGRTPPPLPA